MGLLGGFADAFNASRRIIFGYSESEKEQLKPVASYLNIISEARVLKQRELNKQQTYADRFSGRYMPQQSLEDKANERAGEILEGETYQSGFVMSSLPSSSSQSSSGSLTDIFVIGLFGILVVMLFSK